MVPLHCCYNQQVIIRIRIGITIVVSNSSAGVEVGCTKLREGQCLCFGVEGAAAASLMLEA